jgi:hypothetical protein
MPNPIGDYLLLGRSASYMCGDPTMHDRGDRREGNDENIAEL